MENVCMSSSVRNLTPTINPSAVCLPYPCNLSLEIHILLLIKHLKNNPGSFMNAVNIRQFQPCPAPAHIKHETVSGKENTRAGNNGAQMYCEPLVHSAIFVDG